MNPVFQQINARIFAARCSQLYPYPPMFHKNMELIYVTDGELELDQNGEVLRVRKGALCFTFPYAIHSNRNQRAEFIFISFDPGLCESFSAVLSNQTPRFPCLSGEALPEIVPLLLGRISVKKRHPTGMPPSLAICPRSLPSACPPWTRSPPMP